MRVLHISTSDSGGAARACLRLHQGLLALGAASSVLFLYPATKQLPHAHWHRPTVPNPQYPSLGQRIMHKWEALTQKLHAPALPPNEPIPIEQYLKKRPAGAEVFSPPSSPYRITQQPSYAEADLIHLHWVGGFLNYPSFFAQNHKPVVWTLHDMNPFTGGCHYDHQCGRFATDCLPCPQLARTTRPDYAHQLMLQKEEALSHAHALHIVSPSAWLMHEAQRSRLMGKFEHSHIRNGVDEQVFKPTADKARARAAFGLPPHQPVLLFAADYVQSPRKGYRFFIEALEQLNAWGEVTGAIVAKDSDSADPRLLRIKNIRDEAQMALLYSAVDAFVIPSLEDNLPNTIVESLLCGTPVVGFPSGGIPEMVRHGFNGLLCSEKSSAALAQSFAQLLANRQMFDYKAIRQEAIGLYSMKGQAAQYLNLYRQLLGSPTGNSPQ